MKRISFLIISFFFIYCKQETKNPHLVVNMVQKNIHSEEAIKMLKDFYLNFYSSDEPLDKTKSIKDFVSSRVLKRIDSLTKNPENLIIDYDPFIRTGLIVQRHENIHDIFTWLTSIKDKKKARKRDS